MRYLPALLPLFLSVGCTSLGIHMSGTPQLRVAQINGVELPYIEQGNGEPVVFVHGSMSDYRLWEPQRTAVAGSNRYIAYTQRYFGPQAWRDDGKEFSQQTHVADLTAFIEGLKVGPVHVVAWSYGGAVATLAALQRPDLVQSLALHEPTIGSLIAGTDEGKAAIAAFGSGLAPAREAAKAGEAHKAATMFWEFVSILPKGGFKQEPDAIRHMVLDNSRTVPLTLSAPPPPPVTCDRLKTATLPILITVGEQTRPLWRLAGEMLQRCAPNAQLVNIADSNHDALFRRPADFNRVLLNFLSKN